MKSLNKAFTMIELIFVIVIIGIIAATIVPKMNSTDSSNAVTSKPVKQQSATSTWDE